MADYYNLYAGKSKTKQILLMTDLLHKVENYKHALSKTKIGNPYKFFRIEPVGTQEQSWRKKNKTGQFKDHDPKWQVPISQRKGK